jgi:membrane dipeptidase
MSAAAELHRDSLVCNLHDDWSIEVQKLFLAGERGALDRTYLNRLRRGGVDFTFYTVGGDDVMFTQDPELLRGTLRAVDGALEEIGASDAFVLCLTADDLLAAKAQGKVGLMLTIEGAAPLHEDLALLRNLYRLGLRSVILTWFKANPSADGVGEARNGGLSAFGRELVAEMNRLGMLIDVSQTSPASFDDVLAISRHPVMASHSNCSGVYPHRRNLTDEQLRALAENGGLIGITCFPGHVGDGAVDLDDLVRHVDHAVNVAGVEHVAIGLNLVVHTPEEAREFYERSNIEYGAFQMTGLEDVDRMPALTERLLQQGYDDEQVRAILGGNLLRVIREVMG